MTETIPVLKPEHKLMGKTSAGGSLGVGAKNTDLLFSLVPTSVFTNKRLALLMLSVIVVPYFFLVPAIHEFTHIQSERVVGYVVVGVCTLSIAGVLLLHFYITGKHTGTLLVYDRSSGTVSVPQEKKVFQRDQIEHLQIMISPGTGNFSMMTFGEINLIVSIQNTRYRVPIVGEVDELSLIEDAIKSIIEHTDLPIYAYRIIRRKGGDEVQITNAREQAESQALTM